MGASTVATRPGLDSWSAAPAACKHMPGLKASEDRRMCRQGGGAGGQTIAQGALPTAIFSCQPDMPERLVPRRRCPQVCQVALTLAAATRVDRSGLAAATSATVWHCKEG